LYWGDNPLVLCQNSYMQSTNALLRYNEENPDFPVELPEYNCNQLIDNLSNTWKSNLFDWTASGAIVPPPEQRLDSLHKKVCEKQINSPLCKDKELFLRLYRLTEERLPNKQFFPILIGITNAESSLWLNFARDRVGGTCAWRNNWGWVKWKINDDMTREFSNNGKFGYNYSKQKPTDDYGCWLYPFDSIEEYWISKVNTFRFYYKGCIDHKTPVWCISWPYVGRREVHEQSWINNVSYFIE
jgi:hypothetical protein